MKNRYRAILLDAGGTLLSTREPAPHIYATVSYKYGCVAPIKDIEKRFLEVWHRRNGLSALQGPLAHKNERLFWTEFVQEVFDPYGPIERFDDFIEELHQIFRRPETWQVYPDVFPTLKTLQSNGLSLAVVSNWDSQLPALLEGVGLFSHFSAVFASAIVGWAKPGKEIFEMALKHVGAAPEEVVHVGDSALDDVAGARQVGIHGVLLDRLGMYPPLKGHPTNNQTSPCGAPDGMPVIRSLSDLPRLLEGGGYAIKK